MKLPQSRRVGSHSNAVNFSIGGSNVESTDMFDGLSEGWALIRRRVEDPRRYLDMMAEITLHGIRDRLETAGDGDWKDLSETTIEKRRQKGTSLGAIFPDQPILNESGEMFRSIGVLRNTGKTINIGPRGARNSSILAEHEVGAGRLPSRTLLVLTKTMLQSVHDYLFDLLFAVLADDPHRSRVKKGRLYKTFRSANFNSGASDSTILPQFRD